MADMFVSGGDVIGLPPRFLAQPAVYWTPARAVSPGC